MLVVTFKEFIGMELDIDIADDCIEESYPAFVGPAELTTKAKNRYDELMDLTVEISTGEIEAYILIDHLENSKHIHDLLCDFFFSAAGYCSDSEWDSLFGGVEEEEDV